MAAFGQGRCKDGKRHPHAVEDVACSAPVGGVQLPQLDWPIQWLSQVNDHGSSMQPLVVALGYNLDWCVQLWLQPRLTSSWLMFLPLTCWSRLPDASSPLMPTEGIHQAGIPARPLSLLLHLRQDTLHLVQQFAAV